MPSAADTRIPSIKSYLFAVRKTVFFGQCHKSSVKTAEM